MELKKTSWDKFFEQAYKIHTPPCFLLIHCDAEGKATLAAAARDLKELAFMREESEGTSDYVG